MFELKLDRKKIDKPIAKSIRFRYDYVDNLTKKLLKGI